MEGGVDAQPMSAGELKARLYQTFRERGLVESLKSQLRTKLVTELRQSAALQQVKFGPAPSVLPSHDASSSLMLRATNSLIADHLRRCGYDYSMAVFLPESGSAEDKLFTVPDLLDLMRITPGSKLHKKLATDLPRYDSKGFMWQLLSELSAGRAMKQEHVGIQVETHPAHQSSIERKLQSVDDAYHQRSEEDDFSNRHAIQEKLLKMKREMEAKSREEISREISRFKESQLKRVELEEREKARKEIASARREIENTYQAKSDALRDREQATMDRLQKHQELIERETYAQRQSLLEELRVIKQRETDIRRESEVNSRAAKMEEDKRKALEENLRLREASVANIETTYEKRLREETKRFELDHEARVAQRLRELEQREAKIRADQRSMNEEKETMKSLQEQLKGKARHILELEDLLKGAKSETASAVNRSEFLNEKMRTMVDYPSLKEDNTILRRDLEHAKTRIAELSGDFKSEQSRHEELIKQLSERMSRPPPELLSLRSELEQVREQLHHEKATMQHMEAQWKARLQEEMDSNKDLRHRLSEQTNEMASLMRQLSDLKLALRQTQTALNNNINPPNRAFGGAVDIHNNTLADDMYIDTTLHRATLDPELLLAESGRYGPSLDDSNSGDDGGSQGDSIAFIEQTKARFRDLEREAEHLEQNYQDLQHRMSGVGGLYRSPLQHVGSTSTGAGVHPTAGVPGHANIPMTGLSEHGTHLPVDGSRHLDRETSLTAPSSKYPRKQTGHSKPGKQGTHERTPTLQETFVDKRDTRPVVLDHENAESKVLGKSSFAASSSSSVSSSGSLRQRGSDEGGHEHGVDSMWMSPGVGGMGKTPSAVLQEEESATKASLETGTERNRLEKDAQRREEQMEEEKRCREGEERRQREEERREEERRWREEEKRRGDERRDEEERTDADEEERRRRQREEEEEEQRAWEEKRRKKEEERRRKDLEAREREQRMLLELQKQEQGAGGASSATSGVQAGSGQGASGGGVDPTDDGKKEGGEGKDDNDEEEGNKGVKIDPMMQRYMMMVQQRKQQQETTTPATPEPEVIPDSPSISIKSDGSISAEEMEGGIEDPASGGNVSDKDDPFGDW